MKNTFNFWKFFALPILFFCCNENQEKPSEKNEEIIYEAPNQIIPLIEADSLYVNYKKRRIPNIIEAEAHSSEGDKSFTPTQFVSFDISVLKDYIGYVEQEAKKGGTKADSIRIYLGNYGDTSKKYKKKNTVFLVPTAKVNGEYGGIFIDSNGKAKLVRDWVNENQNKTQIGNQKSEASILSSLSTTANFQDAKSLALNRGNGGPPPKTDF